MVARSWNRNSIEEILSKEPEGRIRTLPSPDLCLPLMSIMSIARLAFLDDCFTSVFSPCYIVHLL
jgi:hypothetical protein